MASTIVAASWWVLAALAQQPPPPSGATGEKSGTTSPNAPSDTHAKLAIDWLVKPPDVAARAAISGDGKELLLENGLVRRRIRLKPDVATVALDELTTSTSLVRAVEPEARVTIDGRSYDVGGLKGQRDRAFLRPSDVEALVADPAAFHGTAGAAVKVTPARERFGWKRVRHSAELPWPPLAKEATLSFTAPESGPRGVTIEVHYEVYDGLPLLSKWVVVRNGDAKPHRIDRIVCEELALVEGESRVELGGPWRLPNLTVVTDYQFNGMSVDGANAAVRWLDDPAYDTQVNYELKTPCRLEVGPPLGPAVDLKPGESLVSPRVFELAHDTTERERRGLEVRRMWRTIAPWCTENPLMLHLTSTEPATVRRAIDQAAEVGFETVIFSFGSGLDMEDVSPANLAKFKEFADYAHSKKVELGGYSLLASRRIDDANDCVNPKTGKPGGAIFGDSPCLCSKWGLDYFQKITTFLDATGFDLLEHDGSYPGDVCASTTHPGHRGLDDSQWLQFQRIASFYRRCRERGVSLNVPDFYFLNGSTKTAMGYRETNWSLPREQQHLHARQHLFDGTWEKTPSMGWMFVPLVQYHGGGAAATIEPLHEHLDDYDAALTNCLGFGAQACFRGPRLYDDETTRKVVSAKVAWFKEHRAILESDVVHLRRADGADWDGVLHVNPFAKEGEECGLAMLWNPLAEPIRRTIVLPLQYAGRKSAAVEVTIPAHGSATLDVK